MGYKMADWQIQLFYCLHNRSTSSLAMPVISAHHCVDVLDFEFAAYVCRHLARDGLLGVAEADCVYHIVCFF